jgi:hypothetical protein
MQKGGVAGAGAFWQLQTMCFHMTRAGGCLPVWSKTDHDEIMLRCARIGFKP